MRYLKQSTSAVVSFGPALDKTDGVTLKTGLVSALDHATTGIKLSKNGGALTIRHATVTATTYDGYGNYLVTLDTTDTNTLGQTRMQYVDAATCLPIWDDFEILPADVWDFWFSTGQIKRSMLATDTGLQPIRSNTAQAGASATITLDSGASATDNFYQYLLVYIVSGTGVGQVRVIGSYVGSTKVATVASNWTTNPDATSVFALLPSSVLAASTPPSAADIADEVYDELRADHTVVGSFGEGFKIAASGIPVGAFVAGSITKSAFAADTGLVPIRTGTAQTGTASTMTLDAGASAAIEAYQYQLILITGGTGVGQGARMVTTYNSGTKVATISPNWATTPDASTTFAILPSGVLAAVPEGIQRNTAFPNFEFVMYDSSDHITGKAGLTVTAQRSIDKGAFAPCANGVSEIGSGVYGIDFAAGDLDGSVITFRFTALGADPTNVTVTTAA